MLARSFLLLASLSLVACGSWKPSSAPSESTHKSLPELHRDFMAGCSRRLPDAPDYCECGWDQMQKMFTEEEMNRRPTAEDEAKLQKFGQRVGAVCGNKLPEASVKAPYMRGCAASGPKLNPYCECTWADLRKHFSIGELADDYLVKTQRFAQRTKEAVSACIDKMPEEIMRDAFIKGCQSKEPNRDFCACAWGVLRSDRSIADIATGRAKIDQGKLEKTCGGKKWTM